MSRDSAREREKETSSFEFDQKGQWRFGGSNESSREAPQLAEDLDAGAHEMPRVPPVAIRLLEIEP